MAECGRTVERIVDYKVVVSDCLEELTTKVKEEIATGWEPSGGVSVVAMQFGLRFVQSVAKKEFVTIKMW